MLRFRNVFVSRVEAERFTLKELIERYVEEVTPSHKGAESEALRLRMLARTPLAKMDRRHAENKS